MLDIVLARMAECNRLILKQREEEEYVHSGFSREFAQSGIKLIITLLRFWYFSKLLSIAMRVLYFSSIFFLIYPKIKTNHSNNLISNKYIRSLYFHISFNIIFLNDCYCHFYQENAIFRWINYIKKYKSFSNMLANHKPLNLKFNPFQFPPDRQRTPHKESISPTSTENIYLYFRQFSFLIG